MLVVQRGLSVVTLALSLALTHASTQESDYYTAAVVEYAAFELRPEAPDTPEVLLRKNAINHMYFMKQAAAQGADIIVFPECGLTGINLPSSRDELRPYLTEIPEPGLANPCVDTLLNTSQLLKDLSCASRRHKIYSVINLGEVAACSNGDSSCPADGVFIFNTNIVFDRQGNLIARYRKYNLFVEPGFNTEPTAAHSMFDTDFGVKFGMFICFDLLFKEPAVAMVHQHNLTDIVYSAAWFSELPFKTAVQSQAEWAYATDTNFLAAGYNKPNNKNTGSGIYAGKDGVITSLMAFDETNQILIAQVKKKSRLANVPRLVRNRRESSESHDSSVEKMVSQMQSETTTQKTFTYEASKSFINYLLQHVRKKGAETRSEDGKCNNGERANNARLDASTDDGGGLKLSHKKVGPRHHNKDDSHVHAYNTALLNLTTSIENHPGTLFLCHLRLCCNFTLGAKLTQKNITAENTASSEFYRVGVYDGSRIDNYQTCLVMRCAGPDVRSCEGVDYSTLQASSVVFNTIIIEGNFKDSGNVKTDHGHDVNGSLETVNTDDHIILRNIMEITNLTRVSLQVNDFPKQHDKSIGRYGYFDTFQDDVSIYNTVLLGTKHLNKSINVCQNNLCCEFYVGTGSTNPPNSNGSLFSSNGYYFRVGVFDGVRTFIKTIKAGLQVCALFACTGEDIDTCGLLKNKTEEQGRQEVDHGVLDIVGRNNNSDDNASSEKNCIFEKIEIKGNFDTGNLIMPNTLSSQLLPFEADTFVLKQELNLYNHTDKTPVMIMTENRSIDDIFAFGVFARNFREDNDWHKIWQQFLSEQ